MYTILKKEILNPTVTKMVIQAPNVAKRAKAGQFIILRVMSKGKGSLLRSRMPILKLEK